MEKVKVKFVYKHGKFEADQEAELESKIANHYVSIGLAVKTVNSEEDCGCGKKVVELSEERKSFEKEKSDFEAEKIAFLEQKAEFEKLNPSGGVQEEGVNTESEEQKVEEKTVKPKK